MKPPVMPRGIWYATYLTLLAGCITAAVAVSFWVWAATAAATAAFALWTVPEPATVPRDDPRRGRFTCDCRLCGPVLDEDPEVSE